MDLWNDNRSMPLCSVLTIKKVCAVFPFHSAIVTKW